MPQIDSTAPDRPAWVGATRSAAFAFLRLAVGVAIMVYLAKSHRIDFRALAKLVAVWHITFIAVAVLLFDIVLRAFRATWLLRAQDCHLPVWNSLQLTLVAIPFSTFLPGAAGGDLAKLFYATKQNPGRRVEIATTLILDRVIGLFALLLLPLLFAPFFPEVIRDVPAIRNLLLGVGFLLAALLGAFFLCMFHQSIRALFSRDILGILPWSGVTSRVLLALARYRQFPGTLAAAFLISVVANLSVIVVTALALFTLNPSFLAPKMCLVTPIGFAINGLPFTPGGLGVGETAFNSLFKLAGLQGGAEAMLCWRVWSALVGLLGLAIYLRGLNRMVFENPSPGRDLP